MNRFFGMTTKAGISVGFLKHPGYKAFLLHEGGYNNLTHSILLTRGDLRKLSALCDEMADALEKEKDEAINEKVEALDEAAN